jgi:hypothetical protein
MCKSREQAAAATAGASVDVPADLHDRSWWGRHRLVPVAAAVAVGLLAGAAGVTTVLRSGTDHGAIDNVAAGEEVTLNLIAPDDTGQQHGMAHLRQTPAGRVVALQVQQLPPAPAGSRYVCWFVGPGDSIEKPNRVAAGSFTTNQDGSADVELLGAVDPQRFPLLGVTVEPDDGNPQRRGPKVLVIKPPT